MLVMILEDMILLVLIECSLQWLVEHYMEHTHIREMDLLHLRIMIF